MKQNTALSAALFIGILLIALGCYVLADDASSSSCSIDVACTNQTLPVYNQSEGICVYFFWGQGCPHCANVEPVINDLAKKYPDIQVKSFEVYHNETNYVMLEDFFKRYGIERTGLPAVFIGDRAYIGDKPAIDNLEESIKYFEKNTPVCPLEYNKVESPPQGISPTQKTELTIPILLTAAAIDSINPCAFSVLIFLCIYLLALGARNRILNVGITYIVVVYIVYFISGLGLLTLIQSTNLTRTVYYVASIVAILAGLINIKEFFWEGKGIKLAIPESQKPRIERYIHKASIPAAMVLGVLVAMVELPCTGGPYLAVLGMLANDMTRTQAIPYLIIYNIIFVLPLFLILGAIYFGLPPEKLEKMRVLSKGWIRLVMGIFLVLMGASMFLGWI